MRALITGASSGIGRDISRELDKKGYELVLVARNRGKLEELKNELNNKNTEIVIADLTSEENCKMIYEKVKDIDILINNAGFGVFGNFTETELEKEINLIKTNITAVHILTKLYLKDMCKKNSGKILNVASIAGTMPGPLMAAYYSSKSYVIRLSESIREELKKKKSKVQISVLMPGPVRTNFNNVADVEFELSSLSSEYVAKYSVDKLLKGKFYIVPGALIKIIRFIVKITPDFITAKCSYYMQKRKRKD